MPRWSGTPLLVAVAVLAAACSSDVEGSAQPSSSPAPRTAATTTTVAQQQTVDPHHITAAAWLGDFAKVDACSMFSIHDVPKKYAGEFGASFDVPTSVDTCAIDLTPKASDFVVVEWGMLEGADSVTRRGPWHREDLGRGLSLLQDESAKHCTQFIVFADDISMSVATDAYQGNPTGICAIGRSVVDLIVNTVPEHPAIRTMPANSLTQLNACTMFSPDIARTMPGASDAKTDRVFQAHHVCHYKAGHLDMELVFTVEPADQQPLDDEQPVTIAGRSSLRSQDYSEANGSSCFLKTKHVPIVSTSHSHAANEGLMLMAFLDGKSSSLCADATKVAEKIWPKLPA